MGVWHEDTQRGCTPPTKASLVYIQPLARQVLPFTAKLYGAWGSLEGNVPCAYKYVKMICACGQGLPRL